MREWLDEQLGVDGATFLNEQSWVIYAATLALIAALAFLVFHLVPSLARLWHRAALYLRAWLRVAVSNETRRAAIPEDWRTILAVELGEEPILVLRAIAANDVPDLANVEGYLCVTSAAVQFVGRRDRSAASVARLRRLPFVSVDDVAIRHFTFRDRVTLKYRGVREHYYLLKDFGGSGAEFFYKAMDRLKALKER